MAGEFIMARYDRILDKYQGTEALRRVLELDGAAGAYLDFMVSCYAKRACPLEAYAEDTIGHGKTTEQLAIIRFMKN